MIHADIYYFMYDNGTIVIVERRVITKVRDHVD